jgi:predicted RNA binding protein YcfA (HicA-like mRNA interferase family)
MWIDNFRSIDRSICYIETVVQPVANFQERVSSLNTCRKKIRELKQILRKSGFTEIAGKGSHTNWTHPNYVGKLTIAGQDSADAK